VGGWLAGQGMSVMDGYAQFVVAAVELASAAGWQRVVLNQDAFLHFGERLTVKTIVENTFDTGVKDGVVSIGLQVGPPLPRLHTRSLLLLDTEYLAVASPFWSPRAFLTPLAGR